MNSISFVLWQVSRRLVDLLHLEIKLTYFLDIGAEVFVSFEMWCWRRMEKIKWSEIVRNKVFEHVVERYRTFNKSYMIKKLIQNYISRGRF